MIDLETLFKNSEPNNSEPFILQSHHILRLKYIDESGIKHYSVSEVGTGKLVKEEYVDEEERIPWSFENLKNVKIPDIISNIESPKKNNLVVVFIIVIVGIMIYKS